MIEVRVDGKENKIVQIDICDNGRQETFRAAILWNKVGHQMEGR
jgi:hypothetical protein